MPARGRQSHVGVMPLIVLHHLLQSCEASLSNQRFDGKATETLEQDIMGLLDPLMPWITNPTFAEHGDVPDLGNAMFAEGGKFLAHFRDFHTELQPSAVEEHSAGAELAAEEKRSLRASSNAEVEAGRAVSAFDGGTATIATAQAVSASDGELAATAAEQAASAADWSSTTVAANQAASASYGGKATSVTEQMTSASAVESGTMTANQAAATVDGINVTTAKELAQSASDGKNATSGSWAASAADGKNATTNASTAIASNGEHPITVFVRMPLAPSMLMEDTIRRLGQSGGWLQETLDAVSGRYRSSICEDNDWTSPKHDKQKCATVKDGAWVQTQRIGYCVPLGLSRNCRYVTMLREPISQMLAAYSIFCQSCQGDSMCTNALGACPRKSLDTFASERLNLITRTLAGALPEGKDLLEGYFEPGGFLLAVTGVHFLKAKRNLNSSNMLALPAEDFQIDRKTGKDGNFRMLRQVMGEQTQVNFSVRQDDKLPTGKYKPTDKELQRVKRGLKFDLMLYWGVATRQWASDPQ